MSKITNRSSQDASAVASDNTVVPRFFRLDFFRPDAFPAVGGQSAAERNRGTTVTNLFLYQKETKKRLRMCQSSVGKSPESKKRKLSPVEDAEPLDKRLRIRDPYTPTSSVESLDSDTESLKHVEEPEVGSSSRKGTSSKRKGTTAGLVRKREVESSKSEDKFQPAKKQHQKQRGRPDRSNKTLPGPSTSKAQSFYIL